MATTIQSSRIKVQSFRKQISIQILVGLSCLLCLSAVSAENIPNKNLSSKQRASKAGALLEVKGFKVLQLKVSDPKERGFAHGWLLAENIIQSLDAAIVELPGVDAKHIEEKLTPWAQKNLSWGDSAKKELEGIFEGISARLPKEKRVVPSFKREIKLGDLYALNSVADWFGPGCSGFTAWGKRTTDGNTLHARTLDFPLGPRGIKQQILIANVFPEEDSKRINWFGIVWPGMVGVYTGMNHKGLAVCLHDAYNYSADKETKGPANRGVMLRRLLEDIDPDKGNPVELIGNYLQKTPASCGNLFHCSWPNRIGRKLKLPPSVVWEWDQAKDENNMYATARLPGEADELQILTNHMRKRNRKTKCDRFSGIMNALAKPEAKSLDSKLAHKGLIAAEQAFAVHSVILEPDKLQVWIAITADNILSTRAKARLVTLKELFAVKK